MKKPKPYVSYVSLRKWGRYYAGLTLLLGFAAVNSGNNLLYFFLGALLGLMALSGFLSYLSLKFVKVSVDIPEELYAKTVNYLRVRVKSTSTLPLFLIYLKINENQKTLMEFVPRKSEKVALLPAFFEKRGPNKIPGIFVGTAFPLGFTLREMFYPLNYEVLVFPYIRRTGHREEHLKPKEIGYGVESKKEGASGDFMGFKSYSGSEPLSRIFWKKWPTGDLYVKKFQDEEFFEFILEIESDATEDEIEKVASQAVEYIENGNSVGLSIDKKLVIPPNSGLKQKIAILEKLALLGYEN